MKSILTKLVISTLAGGLWLAGFTVWAAPGWNFVPQKGQLRESLEKADWQQAFAQWQVHYASTAYAESMDGKALAAFLLIKNGMPTLGFETLFQVKNPGQIATDLKSYLRYELSPENPLWVHADYKWKREWQSVFGEDLEQRRLALKNATLKTAKEFKAAEALLSRTKANTPEWARLQWQLAVSRAIENQVGQSAKHFRALLNSKQNTIGRDQIVMALGRVEFQTGRFDEALNVYGMVGKSSDYWLEALEEKAWTHIRKNDYRKALAELQTVLSPVFALELGPEPYFVSSFANLKICDFQSIFKNHDLFKDRYRTRVTELQNLARTGQSPALTTALERLRGGASRWSELGPDVEKLPRFLHRDQEIASLVARARSLSSERVQLSNLSAQIESDYSAVQLNSQLGGKLASIDAKLASIQAATTKRVKRLAENDVAEIARILNKFHLVEAESIQRLHIYAKESERAKTEFEDKGDEDRIVFPQDGEVWLDELDNYQVNATGCPQSPKMAKKGE
ncbi:MAG: hypothetical protein ABL958_17270 [Bdellovibrionia bacterium]